MVWSGKIHVMLTVYELLFSAVFLKFSSGIPGGADNGERGYMLTFVIAYLRVKQLELYFFVSCRSLKHW